MNRVIKHSSWLKIVFLFILAFILVDTLNAQNRGMRPVEIMIDSKPRTLYKQCNALLIGASKYFNGFDSLKGVESDITAIKSSLDSLGFNVVVKWDPYDKEDMSKALNDFSSDYGQDKESCLIIYFAGHGINRNVLGKSRSYLLPVSCPHYDKDLKGFLNCAFSMDEIISYAKELGSKHALFIFDACFSGGIIDDMRGSAPPAISEKTLQPVRMFITSGSSQETVPDQSIFRSQLVLGLHGSADLIKDGYITGTELAMFLENQVTNYSNNSFHPKSGKIHEQGLDQGDFVFVLNKNSTEYGILNITSNVTGALYLDGDYKAQVMADSLVSLSLLQGNYTVKFIGSEEEKEENVMIFPDQSANFTFKKIFQGPSLLYPDMVFIPGGTIQLGSNNGDTDEKPVHSATVDSFYMGKYEITVNQFMQFINETGYKTEADQQGYSYIWNGSVWEKGDKVNWKSDVEGKMLLKNQYNQPVTHVSWADANEYCNWLSKKTGKTYRLPTEAEWEYAAGNGVSHTLYSWGSDNPSGKKGGNFADESAKQKYGWSVIWNDYNDGFVMTSPVGSFAPNAFGLYDMTGNVWEWCNDWYGWDYYNQSPKENPQGPPEGKFRIVRGGSCFDNPELLRVSERSFEEPAGKRRCIGFRVIKVEPAVDF